MSQPPEITQEKLRAAMQQLVDEGRAEWVVKNGERSLKLTELGKAMLERRKRVTVQ